jgi:hypothetical protein
MHVTLRFRLLSRSPLSERKTMVSRPPPHTHAHTHTHTPGWLAMTRVNLTSPAGLKSLQQIVHIEHIACIHFWRCCGSWQRSQNTGCSFNGPTRRACPIRRATLTPSHLSVSSNRLATTPSPVSRWLLSGPYETSRSSISPPTPTSMNTTTRTRSVICAPARSHSKPFKESTNETR